MKILLDTSAYVGFKLGHSEIVEYMVVAEVILVSPVMMGELFFGFRNGSRFEKNIKGFNLFLDQETVETIDITDITADRYARIATQLKNQGTPIPSNDIWIAAQTMETGAELVTTDRHFEKIAASHTAFSHQIRKKKFTNSEFQFRDSLLIGHGMHNFVLRGYAGWDGV